jgi:hypothetical protein
MASDESTLMTGLRWLAFVPLAFIASVVAGAFGTFVADFMGRAPWFQHTVSGIFSGAAMILVGARVAPRRTQAVKWILIGLLAVLGVIAALGGLLGPDRTKALTGVTMVLTGLGFMKLAPSDLAQGPSPPQVPPVD